MKGAFAAGLIAAILASAVLARGHTEGSTIAQVAECGASVRTGNTGNRERFVAMFRALPPSSRRTCQDSLIAFVASANSHFGEYAALGIATLGQARLFEDRRVLPPLIECVRQHAGDMYAGYCNRALAALTRHSYGLKFFSGEYDSPPFTTELHSQIVADWTALERSLAAGHPIFDAFLEDESIRAVRAIADALQKLLLDALREYHAIFGYLKHIVDDPPAVQGYGETIFQFAVGDDMRRFALPANWSRRDTERLGGVRFLLFRPGLTQPASAPRVQSEIERFPASEADYVEQFRKLDLELRFHIATADSNLRTVTVNAVRAALSRLREVDRRAAG